MQNNKAQIVTILRFTVHFQYHFYEKIMKFAILSRIRQLIESVFDLSILI